MRNGCFLFAILWALVCRAQGPSQVLVAPVELRPVELTQPLVATVMPVTRTTVATEQEGIVAERYFDEGQRVRKGDVLVRLNTDILLIERTAAEAAKNAAAGELAQARANFENAQSEAKRLKQLLEGNVAPEKEVRDALTRLEISAATIATRTATLAEKTAMLARLDARLKKAEVTAPFEGVISARSVEVGQWVEQGDAIADLLQLDPLFVEVNVPEDVIARVKKGDQALVQIDALGRQPFAGMVDQVVPQADAGSRTFRVKILMPNPELAIWPGFFARATLNSTSEKPQFVVPRDAIVTADSRSHLVVVRDGKSVLVPVTLGRAASGGAISVTGDLRQGDVAVVRGNESLRGGEDLIVMNAPSTQPASTQ
jgi:membrane fusion protein (multidrug efflux system)